MRGAVAVAAAVLALTGCSWDQETVAAADGQAAARGSLSVGSREPDQMLLPAMASDRASGQIVDSLWTGLVRYDPATAQPMLAHAASITTPDNVTWTVRLKPGWTFHDGTPVTARSYVAAWNWAAACQNGASNQAYFGPAGADVAGYGRTAGTVAADGTVRCPPRPVPLSGLQVVDASTFTITLARPVSVLLSILGHRTFAPLPGSFFADPTGFAAHPVGDGPYRFDGRVVGSEIRLRSFDAYAGDPKPQVAEVAVRTDGDAAGDYADVRSGTLDLATSLPPDRVADGSAAAQLAGRIAVRPDGTFTSLTFPLYDAAFASADVRTALSQAIDRSAIARSVPPGPVLPADSWTPPGVAGYLPGSCGDACRFDPTSARDLLARAGGFAGDLTITYDADGTSGRWVGAVCASITAALAIPCHGHAFATRAEYDAAVARHDIVGPFVSMWALDHPSAQAYLEPLYGSGGVSAGGYSDADLDAGLALARRMPQPEADVRYGHVQETLARTVPAAPLWTGASAVGWSAKVASSPAVSPFGTVELASVAVREPS